MKMEKEKKVILEEQFNQLDTPETNESLETKELSEISKKNIRRIRSGFIKSAIEKGLFLSKEEALVAIEQEKEEIKKNLSLAVNLSSESVARFFDIGKQETLWDHLEEVGSIEGIRGTPTTQNKDLYSEYVAYREIAENALKQFISKEHQDIKPIYAALTGGTTKDIRRGACKEYGNLFFELNTEELEVSALSFNDSFSNVEKEEDGSYYFNDLSLVSMDDALEAKAVVNLMGKYNNQFPTVGGMVMGKDIEKVLRIDGKTSGYVEAAIFDEITPEKIKSIGVSLSSPEDLKNIGNLIEKYPQFKEKVKFFIENEKVLGRLSASWLKKNFEGRINFSQEIEGAEDLWKELGLGPEVSYSEAKTAIDNKCDELWKEVKLYVGAYFRSTAKYSNVREVRENMRRLERKPEVKQKAELYMKFEKERLFFV